MIATINCSDSAWQRSSLFEDMQLKCLRFMMLANVAWRGLTRSGHVFRYDLAVEAVVHVRGGGIANGRHTLHVKAST